jgi:Predicted membrane protein (DUF2142)
MAMRVTTVLAVELALVAIVAAVVMTGGPQIVTGSNGVGFRANVASGEGGGTICQAGETVPRGTSSLRLGLETHVGPTVAVTVSSGGRVLAAGARGSGWTGAKVTVPLSRVTRTVADATVCSTIGQTRETVTAIGQPTGRALAARSGHTVLLGRMQVEYLAPGTQSWWSLVLPVARRLGLGRAPSGTWVALLVALLFLAVTALASYVALRELDRPVAAPLRRIPRAAWLCAAIACLNAACWSLISPPLQGPDEPSHFAYVQQLAETGSLPTGDSAAFSPEEEAALKLLHHDAIQFVPGARTISSRAQQLELERALSQPLPRSGPGDALVAADEPPLYYALETIPYKLASSGSLLDRLELMRLLSALFAGLTALFAYLFVRETLPGTPWAWTVGGLGVALAPLLGFVSGVVNPDAMLFAVSAVLYYLLARAFRRGLTPRLGTAIGVVGAIGLLAKLNFLGLVPGTLLGLVLLARRAPAGSRRAAYAGLAYALALAAAPQLLYAALSSSTHRSTLSLVSSDTSHVAHGSSLPTELSYIWQLFLPHLPGMTDYFPGVFTTRQLWFDGLVGLYGWTDTVFPGWVYDIALIPAGLLAALLLRELARRHVAVRARAGELLVYAAMGAGVLALVGAASYSVGMVPFWEPRYFLPMLPLLAAALALAARGAGRRWGPLAGVTIVALVLAHDLFSQLLVISRYYG